MKKIFLAAICLFSMQFNANAATVVTYHPNTVISTSTMNLVPNTTVYTSNHIPLSYSIGIGGIYYSNYPYRYYRHYHKRYHYPRPHHKYHGHGHRHHRR